MSQLTKGHFTMGHIESSFQLIQGLIPENQNYTNTAKRFLKYLKETLTGNQIRAPGFPYLMWTHARINKTPVWRYLF